MVMIKDLEEAKTMNLVLEEINNGTPIEQIHEYVGKEYTYCEILFSKMAEYNTLCEPIFKDNHSKDGFSFNKIPESEVFLDNGGFIKVYDDLLTERFMKDTKKFEEQIIRKL